MSVVFGGNKTYAITIAEHEIMIKENYKSEAIFTKEQFAQNYKNTLASYDDVKLKSSSQVNVESLINAFCFSTLKSK
jgi:uncharacterized protein YutD